MDLQTPRRDRRKSGVPGTDPRRASEVSTPRNSYPAGASSGQHTPSGETSGIFTPARARVRIEDRQQVDIQELIDEATMPLRSRKSASEDVWNLRLIEYFEIYRFCDASGRIDYTEAASALKATTNIYKNRVEDLKEKTNKFASNVVQNRAAGDNDDDDDDEEQGKQATETELTKDSLSLKKSKRKASDQPILVDPRKLQLKLNANINSIDPLFRKTQVDYDKGSYRALLLSSMVPDVHGRVSFEDFALKTQIQDKNLLNLDHEYLENDLEEFRGMLPDDYKHKQLVPKLKELNNIMSMDGSQLADLDQTMDNTFMETFSGLPGDFSGLSAGAGSGGEDGGAGAADAGDILDDLDDYDVPFPLEAEAAANLSYQMDTDEVLAHMRTGDSRRSITYGQRKNIHERQASNLSAVTKPKRVKTKVGIATDVNLELLRKKVMVRGDKQKMQLDLSKFQRRAQLLESIDLREFLRLHIRPDIKPETMWRTIERGRIGQAAAAAVVSNSGPVYNVLDLDMDLALDKDVPENNYDDMAAQQLDNYIRDEEDDDIQMIDDMATDAAGSSSDDGDDDGFLEQKSGLYLQRNVDVAVFKDNIWENFEEIQQEGKEPQAGISMGGIMKQTVEKYKQRTSPEVNDLVGPLFFLNLLHLANEKGISFGATTDYTQENIVIYPPSGAEISHELLDGEDANVQTPTKRRRKG